MWKNRDQLKNTGILPDTGVLRKAVLTTQPENYIPYFLFPGLTE